MFALLKKQAPWRALVLTLAAQLLLGGCGAGSDPLNRKDSPDSDDAGSDTSRHLTPEQTAVIKLIDEIPPLPPAEDVTEGRQPICGEKDEVSKKGLCQSDETVENGGAVFVCTSQKYLLSKVPETFVAINPNADSLWPGALVQSKSLINGILDPVPVKDRSPGSLTMTISTGSTGMFSANLSEPSLAASTEAIRTILNNNVAINTPAKFYYKMSRIYSREQLAVAVGLNVQTAFNFDIGAAFEFESNDENNRVLVEFTQEYYTIAFSPDNGLLGFFGPGVEPGDLTPYTQEGNPLGYISSVTYGRKMYILFEGRAKTTDIEGVLTASFQGYGVKVTGNVSVQHNRVLQDSRIRAYVIGGNAEDALDAMTTQDGSGNALINLKKLLTEGANFSRGNAGVPISYTVRHVKDSSQIRMQLATEYTARECVPTDDVRTPSNWNLKIALTEIAIDKVNSWCEPPLNDYGEFKSCLNIQVGETGTPVPVFCPEEERQGKPGDKLVFGDANHSLILPVAQKPGEKISVSGFVHEIDMGQDFDDVLSFSNVYELSKNYEWVDMKPQVSVSGVQNGCKATLTYSLEWVNQGG